MQPKSKVLLDSAVRTASGSSSVFINEDFRAVQLYVDITAASGTTPTLTVSIEALDPASGKYISLLTSAVISATGTSFLRLGPGLPVTANVSANDVFPAQYRISYTIGGTTPSFTFSVGASFSS